MIVSNRNACFVCAPLWLSAVKEMALTPVFPAARENEVNGRDILFFACPVKDPEPGRREQSRRVLSWCRVCPFSSFVLANNANIRYDSVHVLKEHEVSALKFNRITVDPRQMGGVPCIRGLRIPVATVVGMLADGMTTEEILQNFPDLESADIRESLQYAAAALRERELPLAVGS
jgi:uncharacterized protein (DUF433 family)